MTDIKTIVFLATAFAGTTAVAQESDPGGMMAAQGCMMVTDAGSADVTFDGETQSAGAAYKPGPNGEAFVVLGVLDGQTPVWCLTILTAVPVDGQTIDVAAPETVLQTEDGAMVVMARPAAGDDQGSYFRASEGTVSFEAGETLQGQINVSGVLETADGQADASITGSFSAVALD